MVSIAPLANDARVLRQLEYLSREHHVTVCALPPMPPPMPNVVFEVLPPTDSRMVAPVAFATLLAARLVPAAYGLWLRLRASRRSLIRILRAGRFDAVVANEWPALLATLDAVGRRTPVVFDAHEYSPEEFDDWKTRTLYSPLAVRTIMRAALLRIPTITVAPAIAERYRQEFGLDVTTVLNAPKLPAAIPRLNRMSSGSQVRLIHHGAAMRVRRLELMIDAIALADARFDLTFMLVGDPRYIEELRARAAARAPGRVHFVAPVSPTDIATALAAFDLGIFVLETRLYNYAMSLPNKLFDFVVAGLGVVIGPSPAMTELGNRYGFAHVAEDFTPMAVARSLNALGADDVVRLRSAARLASAHLNADVEMPRFIAIVNQAAARG